MDFLKKPGLNEFNLESNAHEELPCAWCGRNFEKSDLYKTDLGMCCFKCISAIKSKGEKI